MDDNFRDSLKEVYEHHKERVLNSTDPKEIAEATNDWQKAAELILKFDVSSDTHDENIEKIMNSQANEEIRREDELKNEERRLANDKKKFRIEFWKDVGKTVLLIGTYVGIVAVGFYFDGKGVIFTSTAGKSMVSTAAKKVADSLRL